MTFLGKILVVINMVMSILFMAFALIVYTTREDLRQLLANRDKTISQQNTALAGTNAELSKEKADAATRQKEASDLLDAANKEKALLAKQVEDLNANKAELEKLAQKANTISEVTGENQDIRTKEIEQLRAFREELSQQNTTMRAEISDTMDKFRQASNDLELARGRNVELAERISELERYVQAIHAHYDVPPIEELAPDVESQAPPPNVEGVIVKVDPDGKHILISLGEDDGLQKGHMLEVWRTTPEPVYIGKVKVETTEHTTAVVKVVSLSGRALPQSNDRVGPQIMPYRAN